MRKEAMSESMKEFMKQYIKTSFDERCLTSLCNPGVQLGVSESHNSTAKAGLGSSSFVNQIANLGDQLVETGLGAGKRGPKAKESFVASCCRKKQDTTQAGREGKKVAKPRKW